MFTALSGEVGWRGQWRLDWAGHRVMMKERNHAFFWYLTDFVMAKRMEDDGLSCIVCLSLNCEHELLKQSCATGPAGL